jgi:hypothetical protein
MQNVRPPIGSKTQQNPGHAGGTDIRKPGSLGSDLLLYPRADDSFSDISDKHHLDHRMVRWDSKSKKRRRKKKASHPVTSDATEIGDSEESN